MVDESINELKQETKEDEGCTSCVVYFNDQHIYCANAGDSRGCMRTKEFDGTDVDVPLSVDHKPTDDLENLRIKNAGYEVENKRVDGILAVARSFGDFKFKS